ncbi:unnamed protein product (macronuclear) [Paramecium tetraurelia]|uniref:Retrotransposon gag domain-containing protein n=1 Tax=Paramecium tetraurelia TaxID=5888 RepID=A0CWD2_PARTE|nr:uncharacterized protein GSPATT00001301001 [Paramecium tetraurelia]CAK75099.1 unnamed protein product [Paramecium tetraurelia]|eukprot:XP_001442496.1 hypothetical protein (macronuclear) [Paramecium tetraurelia strain d4-2]
MRIATGMGLTNNGNVEFWNDFIEQFRIQLKTINEDLFTQSLQVITQQNVTSLELYEAEIEYYIINSTLELKTQCLSMQLWRENNQDHNNYTPNQNKISMKCNCLEMIQFYT